MSKRPRNIPKTDEPTIVEKKERYAPRIGRDTIIIPLEEYKDLLKKAGQLELLLAKMGLTLKENDNE